MRYDSGETREKTDDHPQSCGVLNAECTEPEDSWKVQCGRNRDEGASDSQQTGGETREDTNPKEQRCEPGVHSENPTRTVQLCRPTTLPILSKKHPLD